MKYTKNDIKLACFRIGESDCFINLLMDDSIERLEIDIDEDNKASLVLETSDSDLVYEIYTSDPITDIRLVDNDLATFGFETVWETVAGKYNKYQYIEDIGEDIVKIYIRKE